MDNIAVTTSVTGKSTNVRIAKWRNRLREWRRRGRLRDELARIHARSFEDAGISPGQARAEADRPFWRPLGGLGRD